MNAPIRVSLRTSLGEIVVELRPDKAPGTCENFLRYVDAGFYNNTSFYRVVHANEDNFPNPNVPIEVIQGGAGMETPVARRPPITLERTTESGLKHSDGTISMARMTADSATSEFFICVGAQPELDFGGKRNLDGQGFAAFGAVVAGMDVVRAIHASPRDKQRLTPPIALHAIARVVAA